MDEDNTNQYVQKFMPIVTGVINFMAPHLGVEQPSKEWLAPRFPRLEEGLSGYVPSENIMYLMMEEALIPERMRGWKRRLSSISHEVGHWWHSMINPGLLKIYSAFYDRGLAKNSDFEFSRMTAEAVALSCEAIFENSSKLRKMNDQYASMGFTLPELARMDFSSAYANREGIIKLYDALEVKWHG